MRMRPFEPLGSHSGLGCGWSRTDLREFVHQLGGNGGEKAVKTVGHNQLVSDERLELKRLGTTV